MKQLTRSISMFLVCVMSLCLLTACGGGGGGGGGGGAANLTENRDLVLSIGCSSDIKENSDLQTYTTNVMAAYFQLSCGQITQTQYQNIVKQEAATVTAKLESAGISVKSHYCEAIGYGPTINDASGALKDAMVKAGYSPSSMKQYGVTRISATVNGESAVVMFAAFVY